MLPTDRIGDPGLRQRIIDGADGQHEAVLAWLVRGARLWYEAGRVMPRAPEQVQADTSAWLDRVNLIFSFVTEHLKQDADGHRVWADELWDVFRRTIKGSGNNAWSGRTFNRRLTEFAAARGWVIEKKKAKHSDDLLSRPLDGFPEDPPRSYQAWHGIRFKDEEDLKAEEEEASP